MARKIIRLTDRQIKTTKPTGKEFTLSDGNGLQLRIRPNGTKSWQFKYKNPITRKISKLTLGVYPDLSLANARTKMLEYRSLIAQEIDPKQFELDKAIEEKRRQTNTLLAVANLWFERKKETVTEEHSSREWRTLEKYVFPALANTPIDKISAISTIEVLRPLENDGKYSTVKRICQSLNQIMDYGTNHGFIYANPLSKIIKVFSKHTVKHMPTIRPEELPTFMQTLASSPNVQSKTKLLILWQLHTMTRPKEAARTRWKDINIDDRVWIIPASEMKQRKEHRVALTEQSIKILEKMRPLSGHLEFVFPGEKNRNSHISLFTANAAIKRSLGYEGKLVAHGLRAIASTALHEQSYDSLLIEACLAHADENETRASYNRSDYLEQRRPLMSWWSDFIDEASKNISLHSGIDEL